MNSYWELLQSSEEFLDLCRDYKFTIHQISDEIENSTDSQSWYVKCEDKWVKLPLNL